MRMKISAQQLVYLALIIGLLAPIVVQAHGNEAEGHARHTCVHKETPITIQEETEEETQHNLRQLQSTTWKPIRITFSDAQLEQIPPEFYFMRSFIQDQMKTAIKFFSDNLLVLPNPALTLTLNTTSCGEETIAPEFKSPGVNNSDLHIFVRFVDNSSASFLAYAGACVIGGSNVQGRVIGGRVVYNLHYLKVDPSLFQSARFFEDNLETTLHEIVHVLGFSGSMIQYWWNPTTNSRYANQTQPILETRTIRNLSTTILKSPKVAQFTREHFNCSTVTGMQLENQGESGSLGSHWEKTILFDEFMNPQAISSDSVISKFTFALLEDTNWYKIVDYNVFEPLTWGKNKGCDFFENACYSTIAQYPEFPSATQNLSCGFLRHGLSYRGTNQFTDGCPISQMYSNRYCIDSANSNPTNDQINLNFYQDSSFCYPSNLTQSGFTFSQDFRCFQSTCMFNATNNFWALRVDFGNRTNMSTLFTSDQDVAGQPQRKTVQFALSGKNYSGFVEAPPSITQFCQISKTCPNSCWKNGYCLNGACVCNKNYFGDSCYLFCEGIVGPNITSGGLACMASCPSGFFQVGNTCQPCFGGCLSCNSSAINSCLACPLDFELRQGMCCAKGCDSCSQSVSTAVTSYSQLTCDFCSLGYFALANSTNTTKFCALSCPAGQFADLATRSCLPCASTCLTCQSATVCTQCISGLILVATGECTQGCTSLQWRYEGSLQLYNVITKLSQRYSVIFDYLGLGNQTKCVDCAVLNGGCRTCNVTHCFDCQPGLFLLQGSNQTLNPFAPSAPVFSRCVQQCPDTHFPNTTSLRCERCPSTCLSCFSATECRSCPSGLFLVNGQCLSATQCPIGTFPEPALARCTACASTCASCTSLTTCTSCITGFTLNSSVCTQICPAGTYKRDLTCVKCHYLCSTCFGGDYNQCLSCPSGTSNFQGECVQVCPAGFFPDSASGTCRACPTSSLACLNATVMLACRPGFFLHNLLCLQECPSGYFADLPTASCQVCHSSCLVCTGASDANCLACAPGFFLDPNTKRCVRDCPAGFWKDQTTASFPVCTSCSSSALGQCEICPNATTCERCAQGFFRVAATGACVLACPIQSFGNFQTRSCDPCHSSCGGACFGAEPRHCLSCSSTQQTFLQPQVGCVLRCADGFYADTALRTCLACSTPCTTCFGASSSQCFSCRQSNSSSLSFFLLNTSCLTATEIPEGFYVDRTLGRVLPCPAGCQRCQLETGACLQCVSGLFLNTATSQCVTACDPGFFRNQNTQPAACARCDASQCVECEDSPQKCTRCFNGRYRQPVTSSNDSTVQCVQSCSPGWFARNITLPTAINGITYEGVCERCSETCASCERSATQCSSCTGNRVLAGSSCVYQCPAGFFEDYNLQRCLPCSRGCSLCYNATDCAQCQMGWGLQASPTGAICTSTCPSGQFMDGNIGACRACPAGCQECFDALTCKRCANGTSKFFNPSSGVSSCVQQCPRGFYSNVNYRAPGEELECKRCNSICKDCQGFGHNCTVCGRFAVELVNTTRKIDFSDYTVLDDLLSNFGDLTANGTGPQAAASTDKSWLPRELIFQSMSDVVAGLVSSFHSFEELNTLYDLSLNLTAFNAVVVNATFLENDLLVRYGTNHSAKALQIIEATRNYSAVARFVQYLKQFNPTFLDQFVELDKATTNLTQYLFYGALRYPVVIERMLAFYYKNMPKAFALSALTQVRCDFKCPTGEFWDYRVLNNYSFWYIYDQSFDPNSPYFSQDIVFQKCQKCDSSCLECTQKSTFCYKCPPGQRVTEYPLYDLYTSQQDYWTVMRSDCVTTCPRGFFEHYGYGDYSFINDLSTTLDLYQQQAQFILTHGYESLNLTQRQYDCWSSTQQNLTYEQSVYRKQCIDGDLSSLQYGYEIPYNCSQPFPFSGLNVSQKQTFLSISPYYKKYLDRFISCYKITYNSPRCQSCIKNCDTCTTTQNCLQCQTGYFLANVTNYRYVWNQTTFTNDQVPYLELKCLKECPADQFLNVETKSCQSCPSVCTQGCSDMNNCKGCFEGLTPLPWFDTRCQTAGRCIEGMFWNETISTCEYCPFNCNYCQNATSCDICNKTYYLEPTTGYCLDCPMNCELCQGPSSCVKCVDNYVLNGSGHCTNQCGNREYVGFNPQTQQYGCLPCSSECEKCSSPTNCSVCAPGWFLSMHTCYQECPAGSGGNAYGYCQSCGQECEQCTHIPSLECTLCKEGLFLDQISGSCLIDCPQEYYKSYENRTCSRCTPECKSCQSPYQCDLCFPGMYLLFGQCQTSCPSGLFANPTNNNCDFCHPLCKECIGPSASDCVVCSEGYFFFQNQCVASCPSGFYMDFAQQQCAACSPQCGECLNPTQCLTCGPGRFMHNNECLMTCPNGFYMDSASRFCMPCIANCLTCQTFYNCTSCATGFIYENQICRVNSTTGFYLGTLYVDVCPSGYFGNITTKQCQPCGSGCATCTSTTGCLTCAAGFSLQNSICGCGNSTFYFGDKCVAQCPLGFFANSATSACERCSENCLTCVNNSQTCTQCAASQLQLWSTTSNSLSCLTACPASFVADYTTMKCKNCHTSCQTCSGAQFDECLTCKTGYALFLQSQCVLQCPIGYFNSSGSCKNCDTTCDSCLALNATHTNCVLCKEGFFKVNTTVTASCSTSCPNGFFPHKLTRTCQPCGFNCSTCFDRLQDSCLSCPTDFVIFKGRCLTVCPSGYFRNEVTKTCDVCATPCLTCQGTATSCSSCLSGFFSGVAPGTCVLECPVGYYADFGLGSCQMCNSACAACNGPSRDQCSQCTTGNFLFQTYCSQTCPPGFFANAATKECTTCPSSCLLCESAQSCSACAPNFLKNSPTGTTCVATCQANQYTDTSRQVCADCHATCATCRGPNAWECLTCPTGLFYLPTQSICIQTCPTPTTVPDTTTKTCKPCPGDCQTCSSDGTQCLSCKSGFFHNTQCLAACPTGFYADQATKQCRPCHSTCGSCNGPSQSNCVTCSAASAILFNSQCVLECVAGFFRNQNTCTACIASCRTCTGSEASCTSCASPLILSGSQCLTACPVGEYQERYLELTTFLLRCAKCDTRCATCSGAGPKACTSCSSGLTLTGSECIANCTTGQFLSGSVCATCANGCATCLNSTFCLSCPSGRFLLPDNTCGAACPAGFFGASTTNLCTRCSSGCTQCTSLTDCSACESTLINFNGKCVQSCPEQYFKDGASCSKCHATCTKCTAATSTSCLSCQTGLFFHEPTKTCLTTCPAGFFASTTSAACQQCPRECATCATPAVCQTCAAGFFLFDTRCLTACPDGFFADPATARCVVCNSKCERCFGALDSQCSSCRQGFVFHRETCGLSCPAGFFADFSQRRCSACSERCSACAQTPDFCSACRTGFFLNEPAFRCVLQSECPPGSFPNAPNNLCATCPDRCESCSSNTTCLTCKSGFFLQMELGQCIQECPAGTFRNNQTRQCIRCPATAGCLTCTSFETCLSCASGLFFNATSGRCLTACPPGTYGDPTTQTCRACNTKCLSCFGPNEDQCTSCTTGFFHQKDFSLCSQTCPDGFFGLSTTSSCQPCQAPCLTCQTGTSCLSCLDGTFFLATQNACLTACPAGTYADVIQRRCLPCDASCATCTQPFNDFCQSCNNGFFLAFGTACLSTCPAGFFPNPTRRECQACDPRCASCNSSTVCQSCSTGFYLSGTTCVTNCTNGTYNDVYSATCKACNSLCANCSGPSRQECLSCKSGTFYSQRQCLTACPAGSFADPSNNMCLQCSSNCRTCSSSTSCLSCGLGLFLEGTQCLAVCPAGKFGDKQQLKCLSCHLSCESCTDGTDLGCVNCATTFFKDSTNKCVRECPAGSFSELTSRRCVPCSSSLKNCQACLSNTTCTQCAQGFELAGSQCGCQAGLFMLDGICITSCPDGYFASTATRRCELCRAPCRSCQSETLCLSCVSGLFLQNQTCAQQCPSGFYGDALQLACVQCDQQRCQTCTSQHQCQSCKDGFFLYEQACLPQCKLGFFGDRASRTCIACRSPCQSCLPDNNGSFCLSCANTTLALHEGQCVSACPSGFFRDPTTQRCAKCQGNCMTCSSATVCLSCPSGLFFENSQCAPTCSTGFFGEATTGLCKPCHTSCAKCSGPNANQCQECRTDFFLTSELLCSTTCPTGTFRDTATKKCQPCQSTCQTCTSATGCTTCRAGLILTAATGACQCDASCLTCSGTATNCTSCAGTLFLSAGACLADCPAGFTKDFSQQRCVRCSPQCNGCTGLGADKCVACASGFVSWGSLCFKEVPSCQPGQYALYTAATQAWTCSNCPAKCRECQFMTTGAVCKSCAVGFFQDPTQSNDCVTIPAAPAGEYAYFSQRENRVLNSSCPRGCSACEARDFFDPNSVQCSGCRTGFNLVNGTICVLQASQNCPVGQFRVQIPGQSSFSCSSCPSGCLSCRLTDETDFKSALQCLTCATGFALESNVCKLSCAQGQFFSTNSSSCESCDISCSFCTGPAATECTRCSTGYKLNTANQLCEKESIIESLDCGLQAFAVGSVCQCFDKTLFYSNKQCVKGNVGNDCPLGSFYDGTTCKECKSNNLDSLCAFCSGPQLSDCKGCRQGYYLDGTDFQCVPCSDNCLRCSSASVCDQCSEGTFQFKYPDGSIKCSETCPAGTLPSIASLYYMNKQLFTEAEIVTAFIQGSSSATVQNLNDPSLAIGIKGESVYEQTRIPWNTVQGKAYYRETLVRLECLACQFGCSSCFTGQLLLADTKECRFLEKCPLGYQLSAPGRCSLMQTGISVAITVSTLNADGVQPQDKNLNMQVNPSSNFRNATYSWTITEVSSLNSVNQINFNTKVEIIQEILQGVDTTKRKLSIPKANLLGDVVLTFEVTVKNGSLTRTDTETVTVRNIYQVLSMDVLKVSQELLIVSPTTGVSGITEFQAQYVFDNVKAFRKGNWKFSITIGRDNPIPFVSTDLNNVVKFIVQPHNSSTDQITEIIFEANRGKERYQSIRRISTSQFVRPTNLTDLPAMQQISQGQNDVSLLQIAKSANVLVGLKDLTGQDAEDVKTLTKQVTQKMGEILSTTLSSQNSRIPDVDTVVSSVKQLTSIVSDDKDSIKDMINILGKVAGSTQTSSTLETLIESVSQLQKKTELLNTTVEVQQEIQQKAQDALKQAIVSQAQQLNEGNYETKFSLDGGNIQGVSKFVDLESGEKASIQIGGFQQQFSDEMFKGNTDVSFVAMTQPKSSLSSVSGASDLKSDSLLELTAVSASQGELKNSNLSNTCAVQLSFEVDYIDKAATKTDYSCMHFDEAAKKFVSNQGCHVKSTTEKDANNKVILTCCCNHNTLFGAGSTNSIKTRTVIKYSSASNLGVSVLLILSILSLLF